MPDIFCYAFAEDAISCAVIRKLVVFQNENGETKKHLKLMQGFPQNKRGFGSIKKMIPNVCAMAKGGIHTIIITDLDRTECSPELIRKWFSLSDKKPKLPPEIIFRIAKQEIEAWLLADRNELARFLGIAKSNFSLQPESLPDPKQHLLNIVRAKGRKRIIRDMLPQGNAHIGVEYNPVLCDFIERHWCPERAAKNSTSLLRALTSLRKIDS